MKNRLEGHSVLIVDDDPDILASFTIAMKAEGAAEIEQLIHDLQTFVDHSQPLSWVIG